MAGAGSRSPTPASASRPRRWRGCSFPSSGWAARAASRAPGSPAPVQAPGRGHGGNLDLTSTPGQGSSFWIELPLAEGPVEQDKREHQDEAAGVEGQAEPAGPPITVLYIEDNMSNLRLVERILGRRPGVRLISAMRPELGLELAGEHHPDLVLLDLHLPDMPGETVLDRLQTNPRTAGIPVVILSADARPGLIQRLLEQGARSFLTKPLAVKELLEVLDGVAAEREQAPAG